MAPAAGTVVVTGSAGLLGEQLCQELVRRGARVTGIDLRTTPGVSGMHNVVVDRAEDLGRAVRDANPAVIIHAAFRNKLPANWSDTAYMAEAMAASEGVFDAALALSSSVILVSSSAVYGAGSGREVLDETTPRNPVTAYGRAKVAVEDAASSRGEKGMPLCIVRPFNFLGPRLQPGMLVSDWVVKAAAVVQGRADEITIRHRRTARDFTDVRDAARAMAMLVDNFQPGEIFNVASGVAVPLMEISKTLERIVGRPLRFVETESEVDPSDVLSQRGSSLKLRSAIGWAPRISWQQSLADLWNTVTQHARSGGEAAR